MWKDDSRLAGGTLGDSLGVLDAARIGMRSNFAVVVEEWLIFGSIDKEQR